VRKIEGLEDRRTEISGRKGKRRAEDEGRGKMDEKRTNKIRR